jgi:hypothetical protein
MVLGQWQIEKVNLLDERMLRVDVDRRDVHPRAVLGVVLAERANIKQSERGICVGHTVRSRLRLDNLFWRGIFFKKRSRVAQQQM